MKKKSEDKSLTDLMNSQTRDLMSQTTVLEPITESVFRRPQKTTVSSIGGLQSADGSSVVTCYCVKQNSRPRSCFQEFRDKCVCPAGYTHSQGCEDQRSRRAKSITLQETILMGRHNNGEGSIAKKDSTLVQFSKR